jgi:hypothetical protein
MAGLALEIQNDTARTRSAPGTVNIPSSFTIALDAVSTHACRTEANQKNADTF